MLLNWLRSSKFILSISITLELSLIINLALLRSPFINYLHGLTFSVNLLVKSGSVGQHSSQLITYG